MLNRYPCHRLLLVMLISWFVGPALPNASAQHPNYQPTAGYLDLLSAIERLENDNLKIDEDTRLQLLDQGRALKQLEESYADGSQPSIKRFAAAEKKSEDLANELRQLNVMRKQLEDDPKRTQAQVDSFNQYKDNYNARANLHNKYLEQLAVSVDAENKQLEQKYTTFTSRVKSFTNPSPSMISETIQSMVASEKYAADSSGTKCNHFVDDYAKKIYDYHGFEKRNPDGTAEPLSANSIIEKMREENEWKRIFDEPKWDIPKKPFLQAAFEKAAQYASDGDLVVVGFHVNGPNAQNAHLAIVQKGPLETESTAWKKAGIDGLKFPLIGQAGKDVFASKSLADGISANDLKSHGMLIYVLKQ